MTASLSLRSSVRLWIAGYLAATFGSGLLLRMGVTHGWLGWGLFAASFLLILPMVRSVQRLQADCGMNSKAMRAYNRRVLVASLVYVVMLLSGIWIAQHFSPPSPLRVLLALAVAAPIIFIIRAMALLLKEETDEYLRSRLIEQSLVATGFTLTVGTLYGFLNVFDLVPPIEAYWVVPVWALGLGVGRLFRSDRSC